MEAIGQKSEYDVIVVGGGHNGLVGAFYLARAGLSVLVLESRDVAGGLLSTEEIIPGYRTNAVSNSCHNLDPQVLDNMALTSFGLRFAHPEPSSFMAFPDGRRFVASSSRSELAKELENLGKHDVQGYFDTLRVMSELAQKLDVSFYDAPPSISELYSRLTSDSDKNLLTRLLFGSASDFLAERISSEEVRSLLGMVAISGNYLGPGTPGSAYMLFHRPLYRGSSAVRAGERHHTLGTSKIAPIGGMAEIARAMSAAARAAGAEILTDARVASIQTNGSGVTGVALADGREFRSRTILSAVNPKLALTTFFSQEQLGDELASQAHAMKMDGTAFKLLLAIEGTPRLSIARDQAENEALLKCGFRIGTTIEGMDRGYHEALDGRWSTEPIIWGLAPSSIDPTLAPEGSHVMSLTVFHAPIKIKGDWDVERNRFAEHIIDHLDAHYIPGLKNQLAGYRAKAPTDLENEFGLLGAHVSHGDISAGHMFDARPLHGMSGYRTPIAGFYLGSVGSWPGNYVSGVSGMNAANTILNDLSGRRNGADAALVSGAS